MTLPVRNLRLQTRSARSLDTTAGTSGEVFFDKENITLRLFDGDVTGGVTLSRSDLNNVSVDDYRSKSVDSKLATVIYNVTVVGPQLPDTGNKYRLNAVYRAEPNFVVGYTYVFVQDDQTNVYFPNANNTTPNPHPLNFSADNLSGQVGGGTSYLADVRYFLDGVAVTQAVYNGNRFNNATSRQVHITVTNATPATLYYWCWNHLAMGNEISVAEPGSGSGSTEGLATVATTGSYNDLSEQPVLFSGSYNDLTEQPVLFSGSYNDLSDTPTIPNLSTLATVATSGSYDDLIDKPTIPVLPSLAAVATSGSYADLSGTPTAYSATSINAFSDVDTVTTAPTTGQVLKWNGTNWVPGVDATTGGAGTDADTLDGFDSAYYLNYANLSSKPTLNGFALTGVNTIAAGSGIAVSTNTVSRTVTVSNNYNYIWRVAADDSTQRVINNGETVRFVGAGGITTATDAEGTVTITSSAGNTFGTVAVAGQSNVVADQANDTLTLVAGSNITITTNATTDTITIAGTGGGTASDSFATIAVAGQTSVVADSATDTLTLVAGANITITTDAGTDTVTIASSGSAANTFGTIAVAGQSSVAADSTTDTLTLVAGTGMTITTDASTDTITIASTVSAGATAFTGLSDASTASMSVDQFYLPAITRLTVTANGSSAYRFDQYGTADNPTIYAISGTTIAFDLNNGLGTHPFLIRFSGANYNTGLVHVAANGTVSTGTNAQGKTSGTLYWKLPAGISGAYGYLCSNHGGMVGTITVKDISAI